MKLFVRDIIVDQQKPRLVIVHGLYSSSSNWYGVAKAMGCSVRLVDMPNHGHSEWCDRFSYRMVADEIRSVVDSDCVILGHSFGARVALLLARECELVKGLIMVDISPLSDMKAERPFMLFHSIFLQHLKDAKAKGVEDIQKYLDDVGVGGQMTASVEQAYRQMNIEAVSEGIMNTNREWNEICAKGGGLDKPMLLIRGGRSMYVRDEYLGAIRENYPRCEISTVAEGTHALHHECTDELVDLVRSFMNKVV